MILSSIFVAVGPMLALLRMNFTVLINATLMMSGFPHGRSETLHVRQLATRLHNASDI